MFSLSEVLTAESSLGSNLYPLKRDPRVDLLVTTVQRRRAQRCKLIYLPALRMRPVSALWIPGSKSVGDSSVTCAVKRS